jgi:hypothetical protein
MWSSPISSRLAGVDELIVLEEAPGTSYEDYTSVDVVKRVMEITKNEVSLIESSLIWSSRIWSFLIGAGSVWWR